MIGFTSVCVSMFFHMMWLCCLKMWCRSSLHHFIYASTRICSLLPLFFLANCKSSSETGAAGTLGPQNDL